jgi:isocitrate lyase
MVKLSEEELAAADEWLMKTGLMASLEADVKAYKEGKGWNAEALLDKITNRFVDVWQNEAGIKTYGQAIADVMTFRQGQGESFPMTVEQWRTFAKKASWYTARTKAASMGITISFDAEHAKTPDGYYQVRDGIHYAIAKSLAAAPFADILWMETATANLDEAREFAEAIHAEFPDKMLAYNLSPSFNWDTTGMTDEQMRRFPEEIGKLGFVFNFITYGGHQVDGLASEEFATALKQDGMLALARLQRKLRLLESPYKTPQTLVGGPRLDAALVASSGRIATTKAMGKGSTQHQHLVPIETPPSVLQDWLKLWAEKNKVAGAIKVRLRPVTPGSDVLELSAVGDRGEKLASVVFSEIQDRRGQRMLLVRDQHTEPSLRNKRLMMLAHLFLIHRYKVGAVHYVSPTEDNRSQAEKMKKAGIFSTVSTEVGQIIVADVNAERIAELLAADKVALGKLITKG